MGLVKNKHCYFRSDMDAARNYNRSLFRLVLSNALIKPIWILGIDRWVQNEVGLSAYGHYFSVWGLALTAGFLLDLGLTTIIQKERAQKESVSKTLTETFWLKGLLLLLYFGVIFVIGWQTDPVSTKLLWGVATIQALNSFYVYLRAWVTASQQYASDVWFSVLDKAILIPICFLWLSGFLFDWPIRLEVFILLQLLSLIFSIAVVGIYLYQKQIRVIGPVSISLERIRSAFPYALIVLLMSAQTRLDGYLLMQWSEEGALESGRYAAGYRLLDAANMFGYLVASFLLPYLSRHADEPPKVFSAIRMARNGLLFFSLLAIGGIILLSSSIASFLYVRDPFSIAKIIPVLFGSIIGYSLVHVYGTVLTARGELRLFQLLIGSALLLHLILSAYWVPSLGAMGMARSALISQVLAGSLLMFFVHRRIGAPQPYTSYLVVIFTSCLIWYFG
jgi:O-antigen/teichoic acid export membrane protein